MTSCHGSRHLRARSGWDLLPLRLEGLGGLSWGDIQPETSKAVDCGHRGKQPAIFAPTLDSRCWRWESDCCKSSGKEIKVQMTFWSFAHWPVKNEMNILKVCVAHGCSYSVVTQGTEWAFPLCFHYQQTSGGSNGVEQRWGLWPARRAKLSLSVGHGGPGHHHEPSKESKGQNQVFVLDCNQTQRSSLTGDPVTLILESRCTATCH